MEGQAFSEDENKNWNHLVAVLQNKVEWFVRNVVQIIFSGFLLKI